MNSQGRVLLVEDEETLASTLGELLRRRNFTCEVARTVEDGLVLLGSPFDAVITDIHLPDGNNLEMLEAIGRMEGAPPVIIITGYPSLENALQAIERHAFAYRIKPFDFNELLALVEHAVSHGRLRRQVQQSASRLTSLARELGRLRANPPNTAGGLDQSIVDYLMLLLGNNAETLGEVMEILQSLNCHEAERPVRHLSRHPEAEMFKTAVEHTVKVLDATRRSFKSRELADLRRQLEVALSSSQRMPDQVQKDADH